MANICWNSLLVTKGKKKKFIAEMARIAALEATTNKGQKPFGIGDLFLSDIYVDEIGKYICYGTRWNTNVRDMVGVAQKAQIEFTLSSEEFSADLYAEYKFDGKTLFERALSSEILNEIEYTDGEAYIFRGKKYDSREELCEKLIRKQKFQTVSIN